MANEFQLSYTAQEIDEKLGKIISTINNITPDENGNIVLTNENIVGLQDVLDSIKNTYDANGDGIVDDTAMLGGQLPSYYATAEAVQTAQTTADNAMPKTGGEFSGSVTIAKRTDLDILTYNGYRMRLVGGWSDDIAHMQIIDPDGNWKMNFLQIDMPTGTVVGGLLMPKSGGTFTGSVVASSDIVAGDIVRNIGIGNSAGNPQSTQRIVMLRK